MIEVREYLQGQVVDGQFPLIRYLGGTEHSAVFLTEWAEGKDQKAAIKLIPEPTGNAEAQLTRWRLASKFSHPNLLRLFHAGRCLLDGTPMLYVVTELAEENLGEILTERPLSPTETGELLAPVLDALDYVHSKGFVHGRIQPTNLMAIGDQVKLSIDGIRRISESGERRNGVSRYSAPECAAGDISPASDVWALGMTLVECLTQRLPVPEEGGRDMVSVPAELPAPFFELARHCLNPAPQRRWKVGELRARLERKPAALEETAPPVPHRNSSSHHLHLALTVAGVLMVVVLLALGFFHRGAGSVQTKTLATTSASDRPETTRAEAKASAPVPLSQPHKRGTAEEENRPIAVTADTAPHSNASGNVVRGDVVHRVLPNISSGARNTIWGTVRVRVRVKVDPSGNVAAAEYDSPGPSPYFAGLSMDAAREWKFQPSRIDDKNASSEWVIRFAYTNNETTASAVEQTP
jgi:serine/threonine protein kinase